MYLLSFADNIQVGNGYIVISGSTDGSVTFWDLTDSVEAFMQRVSVCDVEKLFDCQKRPRTGRGSQGGRQWRSLRSGLSKKRQDNNLATSKAKNNPESINSTTHGISSVPNKSEDSTMVCSQAMHTASPELETKTDDSSMEICEIQSLRLLKNVHQSGVNCLHVSEIKGGQNNNDTCTVYSIVSGGDDQSIHHLVVELSPKTITPDVTHLVTGPEYIKDSNFLNQSRSYDIRFLNSEKFPSAHSSSVKGKSTQLNFSIYLSSLFIQCFVGCLR
jgi:hypothetical protein